MSLSVYLTAAGVYKHLWRIENPNADIEASHE